MRFLHPIRPTGAALIPSLLLVAALVPVPGPCAERAPKAVAAPAAGTVAAPAGEGEPARFRVDMHMKKDGQSVVMRRYVDGARSRMETEVEGRKVAIIDLGDVQGTTYTLLPSEKRAIKSSMKTVEETAAKLDGEESDAAPETGGGAMKRLGEETIGGKPAVKYRVSTPEGAGLIWIETATDLPLRMEADGLVLEMKDYDFSPQPAQLFEVPKKYELLDMDEVMKSLGPGGTGMMKGMGGGIPGLEGMAGEAGGQMGAGLGGSLGAGLGASVGGPVGSMIGQYLGQRIGRAVGRRAGTAVAP